MRVAVVGGGISGLVSAFALKDRHEVVLFEQESRLGGHAHTVEVALAGRNVPVDTGFIVFNDRTYPGFIRFLDRLGVDRNATRMSFGVSCEESGVEYGSHSLSGLFAQRSNLVRRGHYRMLLDILRFNRRARALRHAPCGLSLREYLDRDAYSAGFRRHYLLPMCAAIWSASLDSAGEFPADHFAEFFDNHGLLTVADQPQWYTVRGGSRSYVAKVQQALGAFARTGAGVRSIRRHAGGVEIESGAGRESFDRVIVACHSDQALRLLADPSERETEILGALPYQANDVVLHTDATLLPRNRRALASWNYRITGDAGRPATVTYHMNRLQGIAAPVELCVTLNLSERIDPARILGRYVYHHPVYSASSSAARARRAEISGVRNTFYAGAYWANGFHEDGVRSGLAAAQALGGSL
jgi:uncharacterized protein